jgi:hypothetical protein
MTAEHRERGETRRKGKFQERTKERKKESGNNEKGKNVMSLFSKLNYFTS